MCQLAGMEDEPDLRPLKVIVFGSVAHRLVVTRWRLQKDAAKRDATIAALRDAALRAFTTGKIE